MAESRDDRATTQAQPAPAADDLWVRCPGCLDVACPKEGERKLHVCARAGGARMKEGTLSLMQMAKVAAAIARIREAGLPYISILCDPTTGGVAASFASLGDLNIAEPGAVIGFAGRRVIEQTTNQQLPGDFQTAEFLLAHGMLDAIGPRHKVRFTLAPVLTMLPPTAGRGETRR